MPFVYCCTMARIVLLVVFWCSLAGCGGGPKTAKVSGTVTLDGKPLDEAVIEFDAGDGSVPTSLEISGGEFSGTVVVGEKTLRFFAMRPSKRDRRLAPTDVQAPLENTLPDRYGNDSEFMLVVTPENAAGLSYDLQSQ